MSYIAVICKWGILVYLLTSLLPLSKSDLWYIRVWDFPRLQLLVLALVSGLIFSFTFQGPGKTKLLVLACLAIGAGLDLYRVLPYSALWPKESVLEVPEDDKNSISLVTVNVLQKHDQPAPLLELIRKEAPDVVLLLEVNERWIKDLSSLEQSYPHKLLKPLENTYGLALYSKLELEAPEIRYLIEDDVPSVYTRIRLRSGKLIELYGLHPKPPHYETGDTTERDAELIQVAKDVSDARLPVIVTGDLNDVAWSHTTRLFRRVSNTLDPRVGRGSYSTFPANVPFVRFPLDYVFHSDNLTLVSIERLPDVGSDHFPMYIKLNLTPEKKDLQDGPEEAEGDEEEARETLKKAKAEGRN